MRCPLLEAVLGVVVMFLLWSRECEINNSFLAPPKITYNRKESLKIYIYIFFFSVSVWILETVVSLKKAYWDFNLDCVKFIDQFEENWHVNLHVTCLLLGRKVMTNLDSILKSRDITLPTKVHLVKAMVFPVVMYGCRDYHTKGSKSDKDKYYMNYFYVEI